MAGGLVGAQGLAGVAFAVALLVRAVTAAARPAGDPYAEVGYFVILSACVIAVAVGLLLGRRWARTPAAVLQLLLLGIAWYAIGPSGRIGAGSAVAALAVVVLVLLFSSTGRAWAVGGTRSAESPSD